MKKELTALSGIRFLAALYVFIFHIDMRIPLTFLPEALRNIIGQGRAGVNIFFILSGFILTYSYYQKEIAYKAFIYKRLIRLYPTYFVGLLLSLVAVYPFSGLPDQKVLIANLLMVESYSPGIVMEWYGSGAWSISTEFFFYFLFPSLLLFFLSRSRNFLIRMLPLFICFAFIPGLVANLINHGTQWVYSFPVFRLCEFICGIIGGLLVFKYGLKIKEGTAVAGIAALALFFAVMGNRFSGAAVYNFIIIPVTLLLLTACVQAETTTCFRWIGSKWMEYLGKISYAFYIIQIPVLLFLDGQIANGGIEDTNLYVSLVSFALTLLLSIVLYEWIEMPIHRYFNNRIRHKEQKRILASAAL